MNKFTPKYIFVLFSLVIPLFIAGSIKSQTDSGLSETNFCGNLTVSSGLSSYVGRFRLSDGSVLIIEEKDGALTMRPIFWRSIQLLRRVKDDSFGIEEREDRKIDFIRDDKRCVTSVKIEGFGDDGIFHRLGEEKDAC